jgi:hypothetical protein
MRWLRRALLGAILVAVGGGRDGRAVWTPCRFGARGRDQIMVETGVAAGDVVVRPTVPEIRVKLADRRRIARE